MRTPTAPLPRLLAPLCALVAAAALSACKGGDAGDSAAPPDVTHRLDDQLTFSDVLALGTHNSYHVETSSRPEWDYTHLPLDEQLGEQGVRQFELDLNWDSGDDVWRVYHVPLIDQGTTCDLFSECVAVMAEWSAQNPGHHPILTLLELKDVAPTDDPEEAALMLAAAEEAVRSAWGDRVITPDEVMGAAGSLNEAVATAGWPTLGSLRGRSAWVLHAGGDWNDLYTEAGATTAGRLFFPDGQGELESPTAAVHVMNDAFDPNIAVAVARGALVRTRTDGDGDEARANDYTKANAALVSGANFASTDFPAPHYETGYVVAIPEGTPSACNPVHAPEGCLSTDIEDPALLQGRQ